MLERPTPVPAPGLNWRLLAVALHDVAVAGIAMEAALWLRYLTYGAPQELFFLWPATLLFMAASAGVFVFQGLYRGIWLYASMSDVLAILKAATLAILVFLPLLFALTRLENFPRTAIFLLWPVLVLLLTGPRMLYRYLKDGSFAHVLARNTESRVPVLLAGASDQADAFIREMGRSRLAGYRVVGLIDDKPKRVGRDIRGVRVLGSLDELRSVVERLSRDGDRPQRVILTSEKLQGAAVQRLLEGADALGLTLARLPRLTEFARADQTARWEARPIDLEDLLGRPQKVLDRDAMGRRIAGRRVLVTGAGGTIGGELARQIAGLAPQRLLLLDHSEHALYQIDQELGQLPLQPPREAWIADVRDWERLNQVFREGRPQLVFHAAACKHVTLVELNPEEGLLTNVLGTRDVARACRQHGVETMVLISTDKAVNPASVMGASKRLAELLLQREAEAGQPPRFATVRFGNVLGSTGSVVPLFQRQLAAGGPLTVTDREATRYFMTVREAVELVLQATALSAEATGAPLYLLDMGEPVAIDALARQIVRLAGKQPDVDVAIEYVGLRPGEKLHEELFYPDEAPAPTGVPGVLRARPRIGDLAVLDSLLPTLLRAAERGERAEVLALLGALVPGYAPSAPRRQTGVA